MHIEVWNGSRNDHSSENMAHLKKSNKSSFQMYVDKCTLKIRSLLVAVRIHTVALFILKDFVGK